MSKVTSRLVDDIESSRNRFLETIASCDATAVLSPIGEGRWAPIQYLEHLVLAEEATVWRMFKAVDDARAGREVPASPTPDATIEEVIDRTWQAQETAPPLSVPKLGASSAYWATRMARNAALVTAVAELVEEPELDTVAYAHPISGPFTMRQAFQFVRFHLDRHTDQLREAGIGAREGT